MLHKQLSSRFGSGLSQTRGFSRSTSSFARSQVTSTRHAFEGRRRCLSVLTLKHCTSPAHSSHFEKLLHRRTSKTPRLLPLVLAHRAVQARYSTCANAMEPSEGPEQRWTAPVVRQTFLDFFTERGVSIPNFTVPGNFSADRRAM